MSQLFICMYVYFVLFCCLPCDLHVIFIFLDNIDIILYPTHSWPDLSAELSGSFVLGKRLTHIIRHCLDLEKFLAELALYVPKKVRVVLLSKFGKSKLPSPKTVRVFYQYLIFSWGQCALRLTVKYLGFFTTSLTWPRFHSFSFQILSWPLLNP